MSESRVSTIRTQIYNLLREDISQGVYEAGCRLYEKDLAEHYGVSRSPIREVLRLLVADGLVEEIPNRGTYVKDFSVREIIDLFNFRLLLENFAIDCLKIKLTSEGTDRLNACLSELTEAHKAFNDEEYRRKDRELHHLIVSLCGNILVVEAYEKLGYQIGRFRRYSLVDASRFYESLAEHTAIVNAIVSYDTETAKHVNARHLTLAKDTAIEYLDMARRSNPR